MWRKFNLAQAIEAAEANYDAALDQLLDLGVGVNVAL